MQLILIQSHLDEIIAYVKRDIKFESCGYLLGVSNDQNNTLASIIPMSNVHPKPEHFFAFCPYEQLKVFQLLKIIPLQIIGVFHSHLNSPAILSSEDLKYIFSPRQSNLVISLQNGTHFASYRLISQQIKEEGIKIL